ncbi:MAG: ATP-dependent DNA ligase [Candidatus Promineifilaceae bacterium]|jgi:DNA ligase 1
MKRFAKLFAKLDQTTKTTAKIAALATYFTDATHSDAAWAVYFLSGRKVRRLVPSKLLKVWSANMAGIEPWMFDECYEVVGDLAETMALILPPRQRDEDLPLSVWVEERLLPLRGMDEDQKRQVVEAAWSCLGDAERFVFNKLITGAFRVGVSRQLVVRGLAEATGIKTDVLSHRLMGDWYPTAQFFGQLIDVDTTDARISQPYPFFLAHALEGEVDVLGDIGGWQAEWKWDGIRAQLIRRKGGTYIWSRGEDLTTDRFPELVEASEALPDGTVIDGEIVGWSGEQVLAFGDLQRRIGRKTLSARILREVPAALICFDLLEHAGLDIRGQPLVQRRKLLEQLLAQTKISRAPHRLLLSEIHRTKDWAQLAELRSKCREYRTEGLMLKQVDSPYRAGRPRGDWWKWKINPYTIDAVLIYAQRGHGKRAGLYTDYTFALWADDRLVPFAKAYSGLTDAEIRRVDRFVRQNTLERFGPVRSVKAELVFELAFEDIRESTRHKSGIAVRFPRISRWREDLSIQDADRLDTIKSLIRA